MGATMRARLSLSALSYPAKGTLVLLTFVALAIFAMASLGYRELNSATAANAKIRIDRAARAAAEVAVLSMPGRLTVLRNSEGAPQALLLNGGKAHEFLQPTLDFDALVEKIGLMNNGAVNLFRYDPTVKAFERIATTLRGPNGEYVRKVLLGAKHPAYATVMESRRYIGDSPIGTRMRLAYLMPILDGGPVPAGMLAVDVGWVDDLWRASSELWDRVIGWSALLLLLVAGVGGVWFNAWMKPFRRIAAYARSIAAQDEVSSPPYIGRRDEIGQLATGMQQVVDMRGKLQHLAYDDPATGVANRAHLSLTLDRKLAALALDPGATFGLLLVGLNRYRAINDAFGHAGGDAAACIAAERLRQIAGADGYVARLMEDEFAIISPRPEGEAALEALAQACVTAFRAPISLPAGEVYVAINVGIVQLPGSPSCVDSALRHASLALHAAKAEGGFRIRHFTPDLTDQVQDRLTLVRDLRETIARGEIALALQPQIRPADRQLVGFEALARWTHPSRGAISPLVFIALAEEHGLIADLGRHMLDSACTIARSWQDCGFAFGHISVNVSPSELWQPNYVESIEAMLHKHGLAPSRLCLEVTESVFLNHTSDQMVSLLERLAALGVCLSLDDFGTGYSSLGYLQKLPFHQLKIDRSFVKGVDKDDHRRELLAGMVSLGRGLGMSVIAEGAETIGEYDCLRALRVNAVQGYHLSPPVSPLHVHQALDRIRNGGQAEVPLRAVS